MLPYLLLLLFVPQADAFTWESVTSGNIPHFSSAMSYNNNPFATAGDTLYVATPGGLLIRTPDGDRMWTVADGILTSNGVTTVSIAKDGGVWVGCSDKSIAHLYPKNNEGYWLDPFRNDAEINEIQLICENRNELLVSTNSGISRLTFSTHLNDWIVKENYHSFGSITRNSTVYDLLVKHDTIWVATNQGLAYGLWNNSSLITPLGWHNISGLMPEVRNIIDFHDTIFVSNDVGGCYSIVDTVAHNIYSGWIARVGSFNDSLILLMANDIYRLSNLTPFGLRRPISLLATAPQKIYTYCPSTTTSVSSYASYDQATSSWTVDNPNTPLYYNLRGGTRRTDGAVGVICGGIPELGINIRRNNEWSFYNRFSDLIDTGLYRQDPLVIVPDPYNNFWVGTLSSGLAVIYPDSIQYFDHYAATGGHIGGRNGSESTISAIGFLSTGRIVAVNQEAVDGNTLVLLPEGAGVTRGWENGPWLRVGSFQDTPIPYVTRLAIDPWDRVWLAASNIGSQKLTAYDFRGTYLNTTDDIRKNFSTEAGLPADLPVESMACSSDGTLYLAVGSYLYYAHLGESLTGTTFYSLALPFSVSSVNSLTTDAMGQIWVGTNNGLALLAADGQSWITSFHKSTATNPTGLSSNNIGKIQFVNSTGELFIVNDYGISILKTPFRQMGQSLGSITPIPNPYINNGSAYMKFGETGLVSDADIRIFTVSGLLVRKLGFLEAAGVGWDGKNSSGQRVASGVYYITVTAPDGKTSRGKIAVITP